MTADTARPGSTGQGALPERWTADRSAIEDTLAALAHLPEAATSAAAGDGPPVPAGNTASAEEGAPLPTRRSLREAAAQALPTPGAGRRAGLFARMLTVRLFRGGQAGAGGGGSRADAVVAKTLTAASAHGVLALHHRRVPGQRAVVEHLAVGPSGIFVVEVLPLGNASAGTRPRAGTAEPVGAGRDVAAAVTATARRVEAVRSILAEAGLEDVPVSGALCVHGGPVPSEASDVRARGVHVVPPDALTSFVTGPGCLDEEHRLTLQEFLADRMPTAA